MLYQGNIKYGQIHNNKKIKIKKLHYDQRGLKRVATVPHNTAEI